MKTMYVVFMAALFAVAGFHFAGAEDKTGTVATGDSGKQTPTVAAPSPAFIQQVPAGSPRSFQPTNIDPAQVRASMKARAEFDALNREIHARRMKLCEENPDIQKLQANMRELQKHIDKILANDEELIKLKEKFETISPQTPFGIGRQQPNLPQPPNGREPQKK